MLNASPKKLTRKRSSNEPQGQREDTSVLQPTTPVRRPATSVQRPTTPVQRSNTDRPELFPGLGSSYWSAARERAPAPSVETMQTQIPNDSLYDDDEYEYSADAVAESYQSLAQALTSDEVLQALNMVAGAQASASEQGRPLPEVPDSLYTAVAQVANVCSPWLSVYRTLGAQTQVINNGFETVIRLARETKQEAHAQARKNEARLERLERALDDIKNKPLPPTPSQPTANASTSPSTQSKAHKAAAAPKAPSNNTMEANHPSRLALEIRPGGLPKEKRMDELTLRDSINGILRDVVDPEKVQVAGTKWNPQGNCIVVTRQDQRASDLIQHVPKFAALVGQGMEVIPRLTAKWLRLMIHDVRTGLFDANPSLHTSGELKAELEFSNPIFKTLGSLAEDPRWLRRQQDIGTLRSTIVFAVTSKEENRSGGALGPVTAKRYADQADIQVTLRSDIASHRDIMVLDVTQGDDITTLVHLYNDRRLPATQQASHLLQSITLPTDHPVIVLGDFNLDHPLWSTEPSRTSPGADELVDWMTDKGFALLNKKGAPTHFPRRTSAAPSVLDLTFVNGPAQQLDAAKEWALAPRYQYSSDHIGITFTLDYGATPIDNLTGEQFNVKEVKPDDFRDALREEVGRHRVAIDKIMDLDNEVPTDELEDAATALTSAIQATLRKVAKIAYTTNKRGRELIALRTGGGTEPSRD
uniref:Endonuclease/exonuclease/phosphatase domain-containing protein n=1 Tax=Schizophyllum commune (strain H4-8 / FGSC 9210) TaxID=578458 RepID=D8Q682_SCHCM